MSTTRDPKLEKLNLFGVAEKEIEDFNDQDTIFEDEDDVNDLDDTTEAWWTTGHHVYAANLLDEVDEHVKNLLPSGTVVLSITPHGNSQWSRSAEIETELDGECVSYFIKITDRRSGKIMYNCEYESLSAIHAAIPQYSPRPVGWGHYQSNPTVWFLITSFIDMYDGDPDPEFLPIALAEMHQKALSPNGKHGFHVTISSGGLPVKLAQSGSWEDFFFRYMRYMIYAEKIAVGPRTGEMNRLLEVLFNRVIPRLLRPLETGGRDLKPVLLHTNLWAGNTGIDSQGLPVIFDACSIYGHNEFDLGPWAMRRGVITRSFIDNYCNTAGKTWPEEDFEARNMLYLLAFEARVSATITGDSMFREIVIECLSSLDRMVPDTYEEWATARGERICRPKVDRGLKWTR